MPNIQRLLLALLAVCLAGVAASAQEGEPEVFPAPWINRGLEPAGELDRSTPRATLEGFFESAEAGDYERAAHFLNLGRLSDEEQRERGPVLANQLQEVLTRKVWLDWNTFPDRPDALDAFASADAANVGVPRRSLRIGVVDARERPVELRVNRYQVEDEEPVWLISDRTVAYAPALYELYGPGRLEEMLPQSLRAEAFWALPYWQIIAIPVISALAAFVGFVVHRAVEGVGKALRGRLTRWPGLRWLPQIVCHSAMPVALFAGASLIALCNAQFLTFSGPANSALTALITIVLVIAGALVVLRVIGTILDIVTSNFVASIDEDENSESRELYTNISVARRIVILVAFLIGAAVVVFQLNLSQTLGISLLASAGVVSLIFGFAAQAVLGNILASLQIAIAKPIRIGDTVVYEGEWGYVEEINYTYVLIRIWDKRRLVVPVLHFVSAPFENWSIRNTAMTKPIILRLDPTADIERLREVFRQMVEGDEDWDRVGEPQVYVTGQDENAVTVRFTASARNPTIGWELECRLREKLLAFLRDEEGGRWLAREREQKLDPEGRPALRAPSEPEAAPAG
ncbi:mechanosensitive ion channel family protein [Aureimonas mangrovi]|uniref:mechanosensitive ion channel family protein n=1 Tax=Aureimonas mangrovi TaxID=2758041 RepID=UPI00163D71CD|nr:mechanosensitive ion channel family protein [Aureimonas mangrovi]